MPAVAASISALTVNSSTVGRQSRGPDGEEPQRLGSHFRRVGPSSEETNGVATTGGHGKQETERIWTAMTWRGGLTSVVWIGGVSVRMVQFHAVDLLFVLAAGILYVSVIAMAFLARRVPSRRLAEARSLRASMPAG